ncbi:MAG: hypothetical protein H5T86_01895 [Armatimonadetes bacterium]|nr:hypothetical protein [Armatimonadota bacterium]
MSDDDAEELFRLYLLTRDTGRMPWEMGLDVPRRRFLLAALILSQGFQARQMATVCPLIGGAER